MLSSLQTGCNDYRSRHIMHDCDPVNFPAAIPAGVVVLAGVAFWQYRRSARQLHEPNPLKWSLKSLEEGRRLRWVLPNPQIPPPLPALGCIVYSGYGPERGHCPIP